MKRLLFLSVICLSVLPVFAQDQPLWMRNPTISPDGMYIAFTYKGDLYKVSAAGGDALQLTFHEAHDTHAVWSKDGKHIAFASDRYGNFDLFVMSALGGEATRLTFHSNDELPFTFSADNKHILFGGVRQDDAAHRQYPTGSQPELYSVPVSGGRVEQLFTIPVEYAQVSKNGKLMLYHDKKGGENEFRKHHTSSITRDIWLYDSGKNTHTILTEFEGEDRHPFFTSDEKNMYYLSEQSGTFNVFKKALSENSAPVQLTCYTDHPVRFLSFGAGILSFGYHGEIYTMKEGEQPKKVQVRIRTQATSNPDKFISINGGIQDMSISPSGKEIAFIARGEVFVTSTDGSFTKRITNTPEQERFVTFSRDGKSVVYASERNGKWSIFETKKVRTEEPFFYASTVLAESVLLGLKVDAYLPKFSSDGKKLAYIENRRSLKVRDLETGRTVELLTPDDLFHMRDGDQNFEWSPDSKWLLADWGKLLSNSEVLLLAADGSRRENLTESGYSDYRPKWVNEGKQMLWFSNRDGLRSYASSGRTEADVYSMFFDQAAWDDFQLSKAEADLQKELEKLKKSDEKPTDDSKKPEAEEKKKIPELTFDWNDMKDRKARFTVHSSSLGDAVLSKNGEKLYYLARFESGMNLWSTDLRTKETKQVLALNAGSGSLQWDEKMENLYLLSGGRISKINPETAKRENISVSGEMEFDAKAEREHLFDHVWIRTNAIFYEPTFHGTDWAKLRKEYEKFIPHVSNSYEFSDVLSELLGELNVSHAGARYSRTIENADATASLGIFMDYTHKGTGILIREIIKGGPLDKAAFALAPGLIIEKIDGETVSPEKDVAAYLNRKAGKFVLLELSEKGKKEHISITVKPISLGEENRLLYARWVKKNEEEVIAKSGGTLGYVHIPGMSDGPYRTIYESMMGKFFDAEAVIVDTRFNGGGDLVADLAMFFTGEPFITYATAAKVVGGEPTSRWTKPTLAMFNEANYSDGHCFAQGYTDLKIGKTVGMPTPGTCSFGGWEGLANGVRWGVVPVSAKDKAGRWMENLQTEPAIKVKNMPGVIDKGRDEQLERAIQELMNEVRD